MAFVPNHPLSERTITSFRDAVGVAMELADEYAIANSVLLTEPTTGRVVRSSLSTAIETSLSPQLRWSWRSCISECRDRPERSGLDVVLLAVRETSLLPVRETDLTSYRFARATLSYCNARLLDWIHTDGDHIRSFAYLTSRHTAWAGDNTSHRCEDERWLHQPSGSTFDL